MYISLWILIPLMLICIQVACNDFGYQDEVKQLRIELQMAEQQNANYQAAHIQDMKERQNLQTALREIANLTEGTHNSCLNDEKVNKVLQQLHKDINEFNKRSF